MTGVIDTDTNVTPHLNDLKARGVQKIGRYYSSSGWKRVTKTEAQAICAAGFDLFVVFEDSGSPDLTIDRGRHDAQIAYSQARAIGQPQGSAIYFAMEGLPSGYGEKDIPGLKLYFEGVRRTLKDVYKVGVYSNGATLDALLDAKLCDYPWLSASLSFAGSRDFNNSDRWVLAQRQIDLNWAGVSVDTNDAKDDFGAFTLPQSDSPLPAPPVPPHPAKVAVQSPTTWLAALLAAMWTHLTGMYADISNTISDLFGNVPKIANDTDQLIAPSTDILHIMGNHSHELEFVLGITCLVIVVVRNVHLHGRVPPTTA